MKRFLLTGFLVVGGFSLSEASPMVRETPIRVLEEPYCVVVASLTWTRVTLATGTLSGRDGVVVGNISAQSENMSFIGSESSDEPGAASTTFTFWRGTDTPPFSYDFPVADNIIIWARTDGPVTGDVCVQEYQK